ncbi:MAG: ribbon-helix-helix domain-containing protein [Thermoplasmatota archaeon]
MPEVIDMAQSERVTIRLPKPVIDNVDAMVSLGQYATRTEVVRAALRLFFEKEGSKATKVIESEKGMQELKQMAAQMQAMQQKMAGLGLFDDL